MGVIGALCKTLRDVKCGCCVSNRDPESGEVLPYTIADWDQPWAVETCLRLGSAELAETRVDSVTATAFGQQGILSSMAKLQINYKEGTPAGPSTLIAKVTPVELQTRLLARLFSLFSNELRFYQKNTAEKLGINNNIPTIYFAHFDPKHVRYILLMEDVGRPTCDQLVGFSEEQSHLVVDTLSRFHAPFFNRLRASRADGMDWVVLLDDPALDVNKLLGKVYSKGLPNLLADMRNKDRYNLPVSDDLEAMLQGLAENFKALQVGGEDAHEVTGNGLHTTLIHGDPRADNWFFDPCMLVDFQLTREGGPESDIGYYIMGGSMTTEMRRQHELCLLRLYHERMLELLPAEMGAAYPLESCILRYSQFCKTMFVQTATGKYEENAARGERTVALLRSMLERATTACEDWDALGTQQRMLQHLTPEGTVDWKTVLSPEVAREVMAERGRQCLALAADGPEMTACRAMLAKAQKDNEAAKAAAPAEKGAGGAVAPTDVSVDVGEALLGK